VQEKVSPFGPVELWHEVGKKWTSTMLVKRLQEWYPAPPLVLFISNNEHSKLVWHEVESSARYLAAYGSGRDDNFKRQVVGDGWIPRYRALQNGMREGLGDTSAWGQHAKCVAYFAFGTRAFGRWNDWLNYSLYTPGRMEPWPLAWDGASASHYADNWSAITDHTMMSPQIEAMNWVFMQKEAVHLNPEFRLEISVWDGYEPTKANDKRTYYQQEGTEFSPLRYEGSVQFGMWLLRPRVIREFRGNDGSVLRDEPYFLSVVKSVDRVHNDPTLKRFWRKGKLVANKNFVHPYQVKIPSEYKTMERWFLLDTNLDPIRPWSLHTDIPVFAIALLIGNKPDREWLVYGHSPLKGRSEVKIFIPDYQAVELDISQGGSFYHVVENKTVTKIADITPSFKTIKVIAR
jgi:hypothetical protein